MHHDSMKYPVVRFKNLKIALKELEPFVRDGLHLRTGKPFKRLGNMRSREALANWLLCATINAADHRELMFSSDPIGGDGIIQDTKTGETWRTEHVIVTRQDETKSLDAEALILDAVEQKRTKGGSAYASGKTLVVFVDNGPGRWFPNRIAQALPESLYFAAVWVVALQRVEDGEYIYGVAFLDMSGGNAPTFFVQIRKDFEAWKVISIQ